jgi:hypothetical protein
MVRRLQQRKTARLARHSTRPVASRAAPRPLTPVQVHAIREAMRVFVEDDLAGGWQRTTQRWCDRCQVARPGAGFIAYDGGGLCHPCATEYELARAGGTVHGVQVFIDTSTRHAQGSTG